MEADEDALGLIVRRRGGLQNAQRAGGGIEQHKIGEGATDIDAEPEHLEIPYRPVKAGLRFSRNARAPSR